MHPDRIRAAASHLKGHLVQTPLLGGIVVPGYPVPIDLRVKLEVLLPAATAEFRGFQYAVLRQLGFYRGLVCAGPPRRVLAQLLAAQTVRMAAVGFVCGAVPRDVEAMVSGLTLDWTWLPDAATVEVAALAAQQRLGYGRMPGVEDETVGEGMATLGLELSEFLPAETETLIVPEALVPSVAFGLAAGARSVQVVAATGPVPPGFECAVHAGLHVAPGAEGLAALFTALHWPDPTAICVVV